MRVTIETRPLTSRHGGSAVARVGRTQIIDADDPEQAIQRFAETERAQIISFLRPHAGGETIATLRTDDEILLLLRAYEN